ncbi:Putative F-box protein At1g49610 [Linum grandiflorum]
MAFDSVAAVKMQVFENKALDSVCTTQQFEKQRDAAVDSGEEEDCIRNKVFDEVCNLGEGLDWISQLPNELLIDIVSRLTLVEAIRTSVLSIRWIDLWKSAVSVLDFDGSKGLISLYKHPWDVALKKLPRKRRRYMNWVNKVVSEMQQRSCSTRVTKFRIFFNLTNDNNSEGDIDRWVKFAISNRVESLQLAFNLRLRDALNYVFPEECYDHIKTPAGMHDIRFLRSLRLSYVNVRDEILEHFIANCPVLEELAVQWAYFLEKVKVVGSSHSSLPLKHLEVRSCPGLESVEVDHAPHLQRLICVNGGITVKEFKVRNCPSLVDMTLGKAYISSQMLGSLSGCASHLVSLFLRSGDFNNLISDAPELTNLERLTVRVSANGRSSMLGLIPLINVCPRLHTLQLFLFSFDKAAGVERKLSGDVVKVCRNSIKVVEVVGFRGCKMEYEFMEYVMEYFVGLERIVIDWSTTSFVGDDLWPLNLGVARNAKKRALKLKSQAPPTVEFLLI